jgi:hypothetical protein
MPGRIRVGDLPAEVRRKIVGRALRHVAPARPARPTPDDDLPARWRCHRCGAVFRFETGEQGWETHADRTHHRNIVFDLEGDS